MASDNVFRKVQLQVSNAQPGETIWIELQKQNVPVGWSTGPDYESSGGIYISMVGGAALPLTALEINPQQVQVQTTSSGGGSGGALAFTVTLYLTASPSIQMFALRSRSDQGVQILAAIENAQAQVVNATYTPFFWDPQ